MSTKVESINRDIMTKEGWQGTIEDHLEQARRRHSKKEVLLVEAKLFATVHPDTDAPLSPPQLVIMATQFTGNTMAEVGACKDRYAALTLAMSGASHAVASIFTSEMWVRYVSLKPGEPIPPIRGQVRDHPGRREGVVIYVCHRIFGEQILQSIITPLGKGPHRELSPWDRQETSGIGRFERFVWGEDDLRDPNFISTCKKALATKDLARFSPGGDRGQA